MRRWSPVSNLSTDQTTRHWLIVSSGSYLRLALGLITSVTLARALGPESFGVFAILAAAATLAGGFADFGLTGAAVRRIAASDDASERARTWQAFIALRLGGAVALAVSGIVAAGWISLRVLDIPGDASLLRLALLGVVATAFSGTVTAGLQAAERFGALTTVMLVNAVLSAALALALAATGRLTLETAVLVLGIGTSLASAVTGWRLLPAELHNRRPSLVAVRAEAGPLARFGIWLWAASTLGLLAAHLDIILVGHWVPVDEVGAYALAIALAGKGEVLTHSLHAVLLPRASRLQSSVEIGGYLRAGLRRSLAAGVLLALAIPLAGPAIALVYGDAWQPSVPMVQLLLVASIIDLLAAPALLLAYTVERPRLLAMAAALRAVTLAIVALALVPRLGVEGAIAARLVASVAVAAAAGGSIAVARGRARHVVVEPVEP